MNPLFQQLNNGNGNDIVSRFNQFRQSFKGDPQQQIQQLLNSGKVSQEQYNAAVQKAQQLARMMGMKL
jgi:hypothetical protein